MGTSVVRHRIRRRLRAALRSLAAVHPADETGRDGEPVMSGLWLFGARSDAAARLPFELLRDEVRELVTGVAR